MPYTQATVFEERFQTAFMGGKWKLGTSPFHVDNMHTPHWLYTCLLYFGPTPPLSESSASAAATDNTSGHTAGMAENQGEEEEEEAEEAENMIAVGGATVFVDRVSTSSSTTGAFPYNP